MMKKWLAVLLMACAIGTLTTSCNKIYQKPNDEGAVSISSNPSDISSGLGSDANSSKSDEEKSAADEFLETNFPSNGTAELLNFRTPAEGEEVAVIHTSMGDMKMMFFSDAAPTAVENFKTLVKNGYYNTADANKMIFHRVKKDFAIQTGDPTGTGADGKSASGEPFADEFSEQALHFRGAVSMANSGPNTNKSQFFIVQAPPATISADSWDLFRLKEAVQKAFPDSVMTKYEEVGGAPWLDFSYTVFGQVYEGLDILDQIAAVPVSDDKFDKPLADVLINSITLESYTAPPVSSTPAA